MTVWNGSVQTLVLPDGQAKGTKLVLQERGVDTTGMKADAMRAKLKTYSDFKNQKKHSRRIHCMTRAPMPFLPKVSL